jgi:hypothetical protein
MKEKVGEQTYPREELRIVLSGAHIGVSIMCASPRAEGSSVSCTYPGNQWPG